MRIEHFNNILGPGLFDKIWLPRCRRLSEIHQKRNGMSKNCDNKKNVFSSGIGAPTLTQEPSGFKLVPGIEGAFFVPESLCSKCPEWNDVFWPEIS